MSTSFNFDTLPCSTHLPAVRDVDDDVGFLLKEPLAQRRQVRRVVGVTSVRLDDGERERLTGGEDDLAALVQLHQTWRQTGTEWKHMKTQINHEFIYGQTDRLKNWSRETAVRHLRDVSTS